MRCLNPEQAGDLLSHSEFSIRRSELGNYVIEPLEDLSARSLRFACQPPSDTRIFSDFLVAINHWLPTNTFRIIWVNDWSQIYPTLYPAICAVRVGEGDSRDISSAPGFYFGKYDYSEEDQPVIQESHAKEVGLLIGLISLFIIERWSVVLISGDSSDWVEFWEGNIVFRSVNRENMLLARRIGAKYSLKNGIR